MENGQLILSGKREQVPNAPEGYHTFTSAAVQSKKKVLYGFFEIKCRPMNSALSSAFWLYVQDSIKQEEIDIFEICGRHDSLPNYPKTYFATSHYIIKTHDLQISDHGEFMSEIPWVERSFVAGLKWTRDELVWYVDGKFNPSLSRLQVIVIMMTKLQSLNIRKRVENMKVMFGSMAQTV